MTHSFSSLPLPQQMLENLDSLNYHTMTPIQAESLPILLQGKDVIAQAQTGSGKTAAFGICLLNRLKVKRFRVQSLVLCPTRELAFQVAKEIRRLARFTHNVKVLALCGGTPVGPQLDSLAHGAHIVVGTPGRVLHHLRKKSLSLIALNTLVLDEADRMLDMGFEEDLHAILDACPKKKQALLFSATYPKHIQAISQSFQRDPVQIKVQSEQTENHIQQVLYTVEDAQEKFDVLEKLLFYHRPEQALIFCNTKVDSDDLAHALRRSGITALAIHGDLDQKQRTEVLTLFANKSCTVLVATDVAARGLDIKGLEMVLTFDLPKDPKVHIHRIGRTGRAGEKGLAISLAGPKDRRRIRGIEDALEQALPRGEFETIQGASTEPILPEMVTLCLDGGKKRKVRPGDILGALTKDAGLPGKHIGKIDIFDFQSYIAVHHSIAKKALQHFRHGKVKGRKFKVRQFRMLLGSEETT